MKITFNKAAYCVKLPSLEEAGNVYKNYIDVFFILKKEKRITEGIEFFGGDDRYTTVDNIARAYNIRLEKVLGEIRR